MPLSWPSQRLSNQRRRYRWENNTVPTRNCCRSHRSRCDQRRGPWCERWSAVERSSRLIYSMVLLELPPTPAKRSKQPAIPLQHSIVISLPSIILGMKETNWKWPLIGRHVAEMPKAIRCWLFGRRSNPMNHWFLRQKLVKKRIATWNKIAALRIRNKIERVKQQISDHYQNLHDDCREMWHSTECCYDSVWGT